MESHKVNSIISGRSTVTLYTYINHHVGTTKQKQTINSYFTVFLDEEFQTEQ